MRSISAIVTAGLLALAGCGGGEEPGASTEPRPMATAPTTETAPETAARAGRERGTTITLGDSEFGSMLFDSRKQAIYIFENDRRDTTVCYGECAEAWPPVFTEGAPRAGDGVRQALLGTVRRRDGRLQVTYAGKPLYFYAHERPGDVRCHNVNLNGGLWWVVGPDGERRP